MPIETPCAGCGRKLRAPDESAGKNARCPVCGHITRLPSLGESAAAPAPQSAAAPASSSWYMRTPEGQTYGPTTRSELDRWLAEGRVTADCQLREGEGGNWNPADAVFPAIKPLSLPQAAPSQNWQQPAPFAPVAPVPGGFPTQAANPFAAQPGVNPYAAPTSANFIPGYGPRLAPHRGPMILVFGILGIFVCCIFNILACIFGYQDLGEMRAGRMDRSGEGLTRGGMILGIIGLVLNILGFLFFFVVALIDAAK